jgi:hypothetical protein
LLGRIFDLMHAAAALARVHADGREQASAETGLPLRI